MEGLAWGGRPGKMLTHPKCCLPEVGMLHRFLLANKLSYDIPEGGEAPPISRISQRS